MERTVNTATMHTSMIITMGNPNMINKMQKSYALDDLLTICLKK